MASDSHFYLKTSLSSRGACYELPARFRRRGAVRALLDCCYGGDSPIIPVPFADATLKAGSDSAETLAETCWNDLSLCFDLIKVCSAVCRLARPATGVAQHFLVQMRERLPALAWLTATPSVLQMYTCSPGAFGHSGPHGSAITGQQP